MFARARTFYDTPVKVAATLTVVSTDYSDDAISARLKELMRVKGLVHPDGRLDVSALHQQLLSVLKTRSDGGRKTITRQTVSNWIGGQPPKLDELGYLARVLDTEREYILFGSKRGDQIKRERQFLARVNQEELELLTSYREASKGGQKTISKLAKDVAEDHPADQATVHQMRRKEDKMKV